MSEMIDRCRLAVIEVVQASNLPVGTYVDSEKIVRAVIGAMREPTQGMVDACDINIPTEGVITGVWDSMIDAALGTDNPAS